MPRTMKDSGILWIGRIPSTWTTKRIGGLYSVRNEKVSDKIFMPLSVTMRGIVPQLKTAAKTNDGDNRKLVRKGDFAINSRSDRRGSCGISSYDGSVSLINTVLTPRTEMNLQYYDWLFHTIQFADEFYKWGHGIVDDLWTTGWQEMKRIFIPVPALEEQEKIASYLNSKCSEIDSLSSDIQKEIETLEAYKRSLITEAVTKGLNANVEFNKSSIDGLQAIPSHWTESKLNYEAYVRARLGWKGLKAEEYVEEGYAFISAFNIQNNKLVWEPLNYITKERYDESPEIKIKIGDVLLVKDGAGVGKSARVDSMPCGETSPNSSIGVISPYSNLEYRYLEYYLSSTVFSDFVLRLYNGMGVPHLTQEILKTLRLPLPPIGEQTEISDFLDSKCSEVDSIISSKKQQLETLSAYKKSLIYEYVMGKKEVK